MNDKKCEYGIHSQKPFKTKYNREHTCNDIGKQKKYIKNYNIGEINYHIFV